MSDQTKTVKKKTGIIRTAGDARGMRGGVRYLTVTAMLAAVSFILQYFEFPIPIMPPFIKFDFSDLPALLGCYAYGPICGVLICLIKNVLHLTVSQSMFVGELSNFLLGSAFVIIAGTVYKFKKTKTGALVGGVSGAIAMGLFSIVSNYFVVYPAYFAFMSMEDILIEYQKILPSMTSLLQSLVVFNFPFTIVKGLIAVVFCMLVYKPLSPILKGTKTGE